ncbi:MAG: glycosyltransferase family 9 protein [Bacteroidales bacterium]|jgi:heptosyltransferase-2|nr:glycosyltransferase family 9 protein [Bacteroidales bacterium]
MKRILVIQTASIGDVVLATSVLETLHRDYPEVLLDVLVKEGNETLFDNHPFLHNVFVWCKRRHKYVNLLKLIKVIRQQNYDLVLNLQRFASSGLLTVLSKAKKTRGFSKNPLSVFFSKRYEHRISKTEFTHEITRNGVLIADFCKSPVEKPKLYPCYEDLSQPKQETYYTFSPSSLWKTKQMPLDKWIELAKAASAKGKVYLLGGKADFELCESIIMAAKVDNAENLCGKMSLLQSAALMKGAKMNFTNDSAPLHLCSAVNASVTAVFCSTVGEFGFTPLSDDSCIVQTHTWLKCRPCNLHGFNRCPEQNFACGNTIDIRDLIARL